MRLIAINRLTALKKYTYLMSTNLVNLSESRDHFIFNALAVSTMTLLTRLCLQSDW